MPGNMAWRKAAIAVLERSTKPMPAVDIGEGVGKLGLRKNIGRRSGAEIYRVITASIDKHGTKSPFVETEPGYYDLRSKNPKVSWYGWGCESGVKQNELRKQSIGYLNAFGIL